MKRRPKDLSNADNIVRFDNMAPENYDEVKRKFDKMFKDGNGQIIYDKENAFAVSPCHCYGMILEKSGDTDKRELVWQNEIKDDSHPKIPVWNVGKTIAVYKLEWLADSLKMFELMGYDQVAIKMTKQSEFPVELIGLTDTYDDFTAHERFLIAPRIGRSDKSGKWIKSEIRRKRKKVVKNETSIPPVEEKART